MTVVFVPLFIHSRQVLVLIIIMALSKKGTDVPLVGMETSQGSHHPSATIRM